MRIATDGLIDNRKQYEKTPSSKIGGGEWYINLIIAQPKNVARNLLMPEHGVGIRLIGTLIGLGLFVSELQKILKLPFDLMNCGYMALFAMTFLLIFFWIRSTERELDLFFDWLDPEKYEPPSDIKETLIILCLALFLVGLLFASRNPLLYGCLFTTYNLLNVFSEKRFETELSEAMSKSKDRARADLENEKLAPKAALYLRGVEILESYYFARPHMRRIELILVSSILAVAFSVFWSATGAASWGVVAYLLFFVIILTGEISIWRWRSIRETELRPITAELNQLIRDEESKVEPATEKT